MAQIQVLDIMSEVAQICRGCPNTTLIQAYVSAARMFCNRSRWLRATISGATIVDQKGYSLGSDTYAEIIGISSIEIVETVDDTHPLTERDSSKWDKNDEHDVPEFYQYVPEGQFALHPLPDAIYTLAVGVILQPKSGVNSVDETLVTSWDFTLQAGALAYLLKLPGLPWTDKAEAKVQQAAFDADCFAAHSAQRGYNAGAKSTDHLGGGTAQLFTGKQAI
jgi:hypothetical protein